MMSLSSRTGVRFLPVTLSCNDIRAPEWFCGGVAGPKG